MNYRKKYLPGLLGAAAAMIWVTFASAAGMPDRSRAADLFVGLCVKCHGLSGKGDGPACSLLEIKPGDFADCSRMKGFSDVALFKVIKYGGPSAGLSRVMTGFGEGLQDDEISELVAYIRAFCGK